MKEVSDIDLIVEKEISIVYSVKFLSGTIEFSFVTVNGDRSRSGGTGNPTNGVCVNVALFRSPVLLALCPTNSSCHHGERECGDLRGHPW